jgi:hypothetical protein
MGLLIVRLVELLIVAVPVIGLVIGGMKAFSAARARQEQPADGLGATTLWRTPARPRASSDRRRTWHCGDSPPPPRDSMVTSRRSQTAKSPSMPLWSWTANPTRTWRSEK